MPYRVDVRHASAEALDRLVDVGAIDAELVDGSTIAALIPDSVAPEVVADALGVDDISVSAAIGRDAGSMWILSPRPIQIGRLRIVPSNMDAEPGALRLVESAVFGSGLHPTTVLCLEALQDSIRIARPDAVLDVGTGSGVLALGALLLGVPRALAIDVDAEALGVAGENARINSMGERLQLLRGGPEKVTGAWPLVLANVLAAALIEMAPALVRRVGHHGQLVLSGIPRSVEPDVERAYRHLGMRRVRSTSRAGWIALVLQASW